MKIQFFRNRHLKSSIACKTTSLFFLQILMIFYGALYIYEHIQKIGPINFEIDKVIGWTYSYITYQ